MTWPSNDQPREDPHRAGGPGDDTPWARPAQPDQPAPEQPPPAVYGQPAQEQPASYPTYGLGPSGTGPSGMGPAQAQPPAYPGYGPPAQAYQPYGQPPPGYGAQPYGQGARKTNGLAIAALVCSLAGVITGISAPVGAVLGHVASRQITQTGEEGAQYAKAAIWIGWILTGLAVLGCCALLSLLFSADRSGNFHR